MLTSESVKLAVEWTVEESDLLAQVVSLLRKNRDDTTHAKLEVGRACQDIIDSRLSRGFNAKGTRQMLSDHICHQMGGSLHVAHLISAYHAVRLLGGGDPGGMCWSNCKEFYPLLERTGEEWRIKDAVDAQRARDAFVSARTCGWSRKKITQFLTSIIGGRRSQRYQIPDRKVDHEVAASRVSESLVRPKDSCSSASPRDLAESIIAMIGANPLPESVIESMMNDPRFAKWLSEVKK